MLVQLSSKTENRIFWIVTAVLFLAAVLSCNPFRHYKAVEKDLPLAAPGAKQSKNDSIKRAMLAKFCMTEFPNVATSDTSQETELTFAPDTTGFAKIKEQLKKALEDLSKRKDCPQINIDSLAQAIRESIPPDTVYSISKKTITNKVPDSAAIFYWQGQYEAMQRSNAKLSTDLNAAEAKIKEHEATIKKHEEDKKKVLKVFGWLMLAIWNAVKWFLLTAVGVIALLQFLHWKFSLPFNIIGSVFRRSKK